MTPAAYDVVTICARRSLRVMSVSRYVGVIAGGSRSLADSRTRFPHGVSRYAFAASENRMSCAARRLRTSSLENSSQSSFGRIIRHQRSSRSRSRSRRLSSKQFHTLSFLRFAETVLAPLPAQSQFRQARLFFLPYLMGLRR